VAGQPAAECSRENIRPEEDFIVWNHNNCSGIHWIYSDAKGATPDSTPAQSKSTETVDES